MELSIGDFSRQALLDAVKQELPEDIDPAVKPPSLLACFGSDHRDRFARRMHAQHKSTLIVLHCLQAGLDRLTFRLLPIETVHRRRSEHLDDTLTKHEPISRPVSLPTEGFKPSDHASPPQELVNGIFVSGRREIRKLLPALERGFLNNVVDTRTRRKQRSHKPPNRLIMPSDQRDKLAVLSLSAGRIFIA
jgi:hypothetical protein